MHGRFVQKPDVYSGRPISVEGVTTPIGYARCAAARANSQRPSFFPDYALPGGTNGFAGPRRLAQR